MKLPQLIRSLSTSAAANLGATSLLAAVITAMALRNGVLATPDSWAYWEGSVSLLQSGCYTFLGGSRIQDWPPGFPLLLAVFEVMLGQSGGVLAGVMVMISALLAAGWRLFALAISAEVEAAEPTRKNSHRGVGMATVSLFIATFSPVCALSLSAHALMLAMVGFAYTLCIRLYRRNDATGLYGRVIALSALLTAALLTHNSAVVFVLPIALALLLQPTVSVVQRLVQAAIVFGALLPWLVVRMTLGQLASHPVSVASEYGAADYLLQPLEGIGAFLLPSSGWFSSLHIVVGSVLIGLVLLVIASSADRRLYAVFLLLLLAPLGLLMVVFNLTWIRDPLAGRFVWFFILMLPAVAVQVTGRWRSVALGSILFMALSIGTRTARIAVISRATIANVAPSSYSVIRPWHVLSGEGLDPYGGKAQRIRPPTFRWQERWSEIPEPSASRSTLEPIAWDGAWPPVNSEFSTLGIERDG